MFGNCLPNASGECYQIFLAKSAIIMHSIGVSWYKIWMRPRFTVTKYNFQVATFPIAILDLHKNTKTRDKSIQKIFYSTYILLLYLQTLKRLQLLQCIMLKDIERKSHLLISK